MDFIDALRLPLRAGVAAALAYGVAASLPLGSPIYALVSAVVVTDVSAVETRKLAFPRMLGTFIGGLVGCLATLVASANPLTVLFGVLIPMLLCRLLGVPAAARVAGYVSAIIIVGFAAHPWAHARDRLSETLIGIGAAFVVSLVPLLAPQRKA